jgi:hypothetical protein
VRKAIVSKRQPTGRPKAARKGHGRKPRQRTLDEAITALYVREINCGCETFWDGGIRVWIGDRVNGHKVETIFSRHRMGESPQWLVDEAARLIRGVQ